MTEVLVGDCREVMAGMDAESVESIVCDPPYGLAFMGKSWDHGVPGVPFWTAALRVAKPGAHLLAFGGTRTHHRLACAIEDAGWEIRDCLMWLYGTGFPKSLDVSKAIDKAAGAEREVVGVWKPTGNARPSDKSGHGAAVSNSSEPRAYKNVDLDITAPATDAAQQWAGWGTALKPAWEPIIMARKPLDGTVANNTLTHGCGGLNIDGCRIDLGDEYDPSKVQRQRASGTANIKGAFGAESLVGKEVATYKPGGRWPANLILDEQAGAMLDEQAGGRPSRGGMAFSVRNIYGGQDSLSYANDDRREIGFGDTGGASRFFYCPKASKAERGEGNTHPTVKPIALMRYLCRLVTPPGGTVLDPFAGSGSTLLAAQAEGFAAIGIEIDEAYAEIARARLEGVECKTLFGT